MLRDIPNPRTTMYRGWKEVKKVLWLESDLVACIRKIQESADNHFKISGECMEQRGTHA